MRSRRVISVALVLSAALLGAAGCGSQSTQARPPTVLRMGIEPWIGYGPWWIAVKEGYDKRHGVALQLTSFTTDAERDSAFAAGLLDASNDPTHIGLRFIGTGVPVKIVLFEDVSLRADAMLAGPSIHSIRDLHGRVVAYEEGTTSDVLLRYALGQSGMTLRDINVLHMPAADAGKAAVAGRVDAAVTYEPYLTEARRQDPKLRLLYTAGRRPGLVSDILIVTAAFAAKHPDAVVGALEAWNDAIRFYREHTAEARAIIAQNVGASPSDLKTAFEGVALYGLAQSQEFLGSQFLPLSGQLERILREQHTLSGNPDAKSALDQSFGAQALRGG